MSETQEENRLQFAHHRVQDQSHFQGADRDCVAPVSGVFEALGFAANTFRIQLGKIGILPATLCLALLLVSGLAHANDRLLIKEANAALSHKDYSTAFSKFSILAQHGNAAAQFNLGAFYLNGQGVRKDEKKAYEWFEKSAAQGNARAAKILKKMDEKKQAAAKEQAVAKEKTAAPLSVPASKSYPTAAASRAKPERSSKPSRSRFSSPEYYVGVSLGGTGKLSGIKNSSSLGLLGGYKFNSSFGVELAYNSLYRNANADSLISATYPGTTGTFDLTSFSVAGQYTYGLGNNIFLLGNLGLHSSSFKIKSAGNGSATGSSSGLVVGVKVQYDLSRNIGIRGGFDTYTESGGITGNITEVGVAVIAMF